MSMSVLSALETLGSARFETPAILKRLVSAHRRLAEFKGLGQTIPNQAMLVDSLVLQEAKDSSAIENIFTTNDVLFRSFAAKTSHVDPATKEVLRYREALWNGFASLKVRPVLSTNLLITIVQTIIGNDAGIRNVAGVVIANGTTGKTIYTPPEGEGVLRDKLANLEQFMHADDAMEPLVKLALIHYQFEAIHPFLDGNGRIGRLLISLLLGDWKLLPLPLLYLSAYFERHRQPYYDLLFAVSERGVWHEWVVFFLRQMGESTYGKTYIADEIIAIISGHAEANSTFGLES